MKKAIKTILIAFSVVKDLYIILMNEIYTKESLI